MAHKYNNTVILSKGGEHGKRVIQWWKEQGVDTKEILGIYEGWYYGLIDGIFRSVNSLEPDIKLIELPESNPQSLIHEYLVDETPTPKIIDLSNVEGVEMMVSGDEKEWEVSKVVAKFGKCHITKEGTFVIAKPILPQYTMKELQKIVGHEFEIKEVSNE